MYMLGTNDSVIQRYDLTNAWNISSINSDPALALSEEFSIINTANPTGLHIDTDGLNITICGSDTPDLQYYNISIGWDITSNAGITSTYSTNSDTLRLGFGCKSGEIYFSEFFNDVEEQVLQYDEDVNLTDLDSINDEIGILLTYVEDDANLQDPAVEFDNFGQLGAYGLKFETSWVLKSQLDAAYPLGIEAEIDKEYIPIYEVTNGEIYPVIKELEESANKLKIELYRKTTPIERVQLARHGSRPTTLNYIKYLIKDFIQFHGDRRFMDDKAIVGGIGFFEGMPVTIIGHQKGRSTKENIERHFGMAHPEGYRKALRLMKQAEKFNRPIINLIDTPGAYPGLGAEERGQGEAIAFNLFEMSSLKTPIIAVITGEGGSGGALALGVADRVFMLANTIYSVISPEGCASILWKDSSRSDEAAVSLKIDPNSLLSMGVIDDIIEEPQGGAHENHEAAADQIRKKLLITLEELMQYPSEVLLEKRYNKYRRLGQYKEV